MKRLFVVLVMAAVTGGGIFLSTREVAPPSHKVEKTLPNDQFLK